MLSPREQMSLVSFVPISGRYPRLLTDCEGAGLSAQWGRDQEAVADGGGWTGNPVTDA